MTDSSRCQLASKLCETRAQTILLAAVCALSNAAAFAADEASLKDQLGAFTTDLSMPSAPAAVHVGLSAEGILLPKNRREFEVGVSNLFKGAGSPAGAIEFAPYYIFNGGKLKYEEYRTDNVLRSETKTTLGFAAGTRKIGDAAVSATGFSIATVLVDLGDPIYSHALKTCVDGVQKAMVKRIGEQEAGTVSSVATLAKKATLTAESRDDKAVADYKACLSARESELWNRTRVGVGIATGSGREQTGDRRKVHYGTGYWISAQYGFEPWSTLTRTLRDNGYYDCEEAAGDCKLRAVSRMEQVAAVTLHARRTNGASDLDLATPGDLARLSNTLVGVRFTYGSQRRSVFLEASRATTSGGSERKRTDQHALGASFKVSENLWVNVVSARRKQFVNDKLDNVVDLNFQYGAASEPLVTPR